LINLILFTNNIKNPKVIQKEGGVSTLDNAELQQACQTRGMRTLGVPKRRLQNDLQQWIGFFFFFFLTKLIN